MVELNISADPDLLSAEDQEPSLITAVFTDDGAPIAGVEVYFTLEGEGYIGRDSDITNIYGEAYCWFYPEGVGGSNVTATIWWYEEERV